MPNYYISASPIKSIDVVLVYTRLVNKSCTLIYFYSIKFGISIYYHYLCCYKTLKNYNMKQTKEQLLATIEKLKKQVEAIDNEPTILSMEVTKTVKFEVAKEDEKGLYTFDEANEINFNGWRLPTIQELEAMYEAKIITEGSYWSSTEFSSNAWYFHFNVGYSNYTNKNAAYRVRAVRTIK